ncbi:MAG TPA: transporter [Anaeromyxobacteraceae bacterium]|nr:transporter [Anaeromyxobacteraceae bacterium]
MNLHPWKLVVALIVVIAVASPADAKEGVDQYPVGVDGLMAGALPPPGTYLLNLVALAHGEVKDGNGDDVGVSANAQFEVLRLVHVTSATFLGAQYGFGAILPYWHQSASIRTPLGKTKLSADGPGDVSINPVYLNWHLQQGLHVLATVDLNLPTGRFRDDGLSQGAGYYSASPNVAVTWFAPAGIEASGKVLYNVKKRNPVTLVDSGDELEVDFAAAKSFGAIAVGAGGYYTIQTTDDELDGESVGGKAEGLALGLQARYQLPFGTFIGMWHHDVMSEDRLGADRVYLKLMLPL